MTQFKEATLLVAVAGEKTRMAKANLHSHIVLTDAAMRAFVDTDPRGTPLLMNHSGTQRAGHVARWSIGSHLGQTALIAHCRITDLTLDVREGMPVSIGLTHLNRMGVDGEARVTEMEARELSIISTGELAAMRTAKVLDVGPVQGTPDAVVLPRPAATVSQYGITREHKGAGPCTVDPGCAETGDHFHA